MAKSLLTVCGIDYSMSSPAITIHVGKDWSIDNCQIYYISKVKKYSNAGPYSFLNQCLIDTDYLDDIQRYTKLANWVQSKIESPMSKASHFEAQIEGYSFGSKGMVVNIGENGGILKYKLWSENGITPKIVPPTTVKKFATGKGNAKKLQMYEAFVADTGKDIAKHFESNPESSPISDIVDSYWVAKLLFTRLTIES